jgi:phosphoserine phosphatase RsbU/P
MAHPASFPARRADLQIEGFLLLQKAAQQLSSILDLDTLLNEIVTNVASTFGCSRTAILLKEDGHLIVTAVRGLSEAIRAGTRFSIDGPGVVARVAATGKAIYVPRVQDFAGYIRCEPSTRTEIAIPLIFRGRVIGVFDAQSSEADGFPPEQQELLQALAAHIAIAVENARLFRVEREARELADAEQADARQIQRALFPDDIRLNDIDVSGRCTPVRAVGGDWYDFIPHGRGLCTVVLGDVAGKGASAALLMAATRSMVRQLTKARRSPSAILTQLNESILKDFPEGRFVTMLLAVIDSRTGNLTIAGAGHPAPMMQECGGRVDQGRN